MDIQREIFLKAKPERVWRALADSKEFASWFGDSVEGDFVAGQPVWMSCMGIRFQIQVEEMTPPSVFRWTWHPGMPDRSIDYSTEPKTEVTFRLKPKDGGTLLTVTETGFDRISVVRRAAVFADNQQGWDIQVRNLEKYVTAAA